MNIRVAVILLLSFAKLVYNEVVAGNIVIEAPPGYLKEIRKAIDTLEEAVQKL